LNFHYYSINLISTSSCIMESLMFR